MEEKLTEMHEQLVNGLGTVISRLDGLEQGQQGVVERVTQLEEFKPSPSGWNFQMNSKLLKYQRLRQCTCQLENTNFGREPTHKQQNNKAKLSGANRAKRQTRVC